MTLLSKRKWVPMIINLSPIDLKRGILLTHAGLHVDDPSCDL